jgi:hypothetical protein
LVFSLDDNTRQLVGNVCEDDTEAQCILAVCVGEFRRGEPERVTTANSSLEQVGSGMKWPAIIRRECGRDWR